MDYTAAITELADEATADAIAADVEAGYRWVADPEHAEVVALQSPEGRTAIIFYLSDGEAADFEVGDWWSERHDQ